MSKFKTIKDLKIDEDACEDIGILLVDVKQDPRPNDDKMEIYLEDFDINEMPGRKTITIGKA